MTKEKLPTEIHDHFRKANILHGYVVTELGEASQHALETGQELLEAKARCPHGRWEKECVRLFDGSLRTAQSYMQFAKHMNALPKAQKSAVLFLEGSIDGAAKAAKAAAKPKPQKPEPDETIDVESSPPTPAQVQEGVASVMADDPVDYGKCPACAGVKWLATDDGVVCAKCQHPHGEPAGDADEDRVKTQRQKTVKTIDALMRAFDDLNTMLAKPEHPETITTCKGLLRVAREWT